MSAQDEQAEALNRTAIQLKGSALKVGWLTKEGGKGLKKNWKKRLFILHGEYLYYFIDESVRLQRQTWQFVTSRDRPPLYIDH